MRLESFCRFAMRYLDASWHRPYGHVGEDGEAIGFGHGDGSVSGEIEGAFVWANYPRRRQDGVWTPNLRGKIALHDGGEVLVSIHGQSIQETGPTPRRAILARAELTTEASPYRMAEHVLPRRRRRDRRGARELVARHLCLRERTGAGPAGARRRATGAIPPARPTGGRLVVGRAGPEDRLRVAWTRGRAVETMGGMGGRRATAGLGLAIVFSVLAAACGSSDPPTASAADCEKRLGKFRKALVDLDEQMGIDIGYDAYEARVSDLKVLWESVDVRALENGMPECWAVADAGWDALYEYMEASDLWTDCWQDVSCRTGETEQPLLFENWQRAARSVASMEAGLKRMKQHPTNDTCPTGATMSEMGYCVAD